MAPPRKARTACLHCKAPVESLKGKYCNNFCQNEHQYHEYVARWKAGLETGNTGQGRYLRVANPVRRYLFKKFGAKCTRCGWSERHPITLKVPVNVEHLDGNPFNSKEENLTLLCPNCHSLTETYGNLNFGNGRNRGEMGL